METEWRGEKTRNEGVRRRKNVSCSPISLLGSLPEGQWRGSEGGMEMEGKGEGSLLMELSTHARCNV